MIPQLSPRFFWVVAGIWFLFGIAGAAYRTLRLAQADKPEGPDGFVLAFMVFAFAVFILPLVSKLDFSDKGASIEFRKEAEQVTDEVSEKLKRAITSVASLLRDWLALQNTVQWQFTVPDLAKSKAGYAYAVSVASSAIKDAAIWLFSKDEPWRITVWQQSRTKTGLVFAFGIGFNGKDQSKLALSKDTTKAFGDVAFVLQDDEYVGDAFRNLRVGNYADAPLSNRPPAPEELDYHGIMFVPILRDGRRWAVMIVERVMESRYNDSAEVVASALGNFIGSVLSYPLAEYPAD